MKIFLMIMLFVLSSCKENEVSPYLNYSSEECIADEDCVWDAFNRIAFGDEIQNNNELQYIRKWVPSRPVVVGLLGDNNKKFEPMVMHHLKMLNAHIDHPVKMWETGLYTNIVIVFTDNYEKTIYKTYKKDIEGIYTRVAGDKNALFKSYERIKNYTNPDCFANIRSNKKGEIGLSMVFILNTYSRKKTWECIQEEVTQSLGLPNDYLGAKYTTFNDLGINSDMTKLDWLLLQILYHENIKPGMSKEEVRQQFSAIYHQLTNEKHND